MTWPYRAWGPIPHGCFAARSGVLLLALAAPLPAPLPAARMVAFVAENLDTPDRRLDLDYVPHRARRKRVSAALVFAFVFGGSNTDLIVTEHPEET